MKRIVALFLIIVFLLVACSPVGYSRAVQLPPELVALIGMLVMVAVTAAAKWLGDKLGGIDLSGRAAEIASAFAAVLVLVINYLLGLVPAAYDNLLAGVFAFLIVFLGGTGIYSLFLRKRTALVALGAGEKTIRAKFKVVSIIQHSDNQSARTVKLAPYYDQSIPEDRRFAQTTPSGELSMYVTNPAALEQLELGKFFYLDFVPVEEK